MHYTVSSLEKAEMEKYSKKPKSDQHESLCSRISNYAISTITSWSFICSGGQCYNVGASALSNIWIVSSLIQPLSVLLISFALYTVWKKQRMSKIFLMALVGGLLIIFANFFDLGFLTLLTGNGLMLTGSYLNIKSEGYQEVKDGKFDV